MAHPPRTDDDFAREVDSHLALEADRLIADGMSPADAQAAARRAFGSRTRAQVQFYESRRPMWLEQGVRDLRRAVRTVLRHGRVNALVVLMLALGISVNLAMFSVMRAVLLAPMPYADVDRLVMIWQTDRAAGTTREPASIPDYADIDRRATTLDTTAAFTGADVNVTPTTGDDPYRIAALSVSASFLPLLSADPLVGRVFSRIDDQPGGERVVIIGERLWQERFDRDPQVTQRTLRINDEPHAILGVMPRTADYGVQQILSAAAYNRGFVDRGDVRVDAWLPLRADPATTSRDNHPIFVLGRVASGVPLTAASADLTRIAADLERTYPSSNEARGVFVESLDDVVRGPVRPALYALMGAVALVLAVACVNAASLLLVQGAGRAREVAVRTALGANRQHLLGHFLAEAVVLGIAAVGLGVVLGWWALRVLASLAPASLPGASAIAIDLPAIAAAGLIGAVTTLGAALLPALQARHGRAQDALKAEAGRTASAGRARRRTLATLTVSQLALAMILVTGAGLLVRSFWQLRTVDPGFRVDGILKAEFELPEGRYPRDFRTFPRWPEVARFNDTVLRGVAAIPGVEAVAVASDHPLAAGTTNSFVVVGREAEARNWPEMSVRSISADYAAVTGLRLFAGRQLSASDTADAPAVLIINATARRMFFPRQDPLGQQIAFWGTRRTIVGVVADEKIHGVAQATPPVAYAPLGQLPLADTLLVRVKGEPEAVASDVRQVFRDADPGLAIFGLEPLHHTLTTSLSRERFTMLLLGLFAGLTLLLATLGVYGVLSYGVSQRTTEIGIRLALGARPGSIVRMIMQQGVGLLIVGLSVGGAGALLLGRLIAALLFGVTTHDMWTFSAAVSVMSVAALVAAYLPARRAARLAPALALSAK
jgi:putative ABC transport system permease protein